LQLVLHDPFDGSRLKWLAADFGIAIDVYQEPGAQDQGELGITAVVLIDEVGYKIV